MSSDIKTCYLSIALPLRHYGSEKKAIEFKLNDLLNHYVAAVDGVLTKWSDLVIMNDKGIIKDDQPYIFWKVSFTAHVCRPVAGKLVRAKVHSILKTYFLAKALNSLIVTVTIPESLLEHEIVKNLMVDHDVYFRMKGSSEGTYRGELDEESIELIEALIKEECVSKADKGAYGYAKDFEY